MIKLAILIPTLTERADKLKRLTTALEYQISRLQNPGEVKILVNEDQGQLTTGKKRSALLDWAFEIDAQYECGIDDDDLPSKDYVRHQMAVAESGMDCGSLWGQIYTHGRAGNPFHHSLKYDHWYQDEKYYYRNPNHLNCIRMKCLEKIRFKDQTIGEDGHFSIALHEAQVLKTEFEINEIIYHYFDGRKGSPIETDIYNQIMS